MHELGFIMELKTLRSFLAIAREGNVTAAAESLHVTQPTLSRQLATLEEELGTPLFLRGSRKLTLTEGGARFRKRAEEILELVAKVQAEFRQPLDNVSGDIYIGSGETWVLGLVADTMRSMREEYPHVRFHIFSGDGDEVAERLNSGLLDFGIFIEPASVAGYESLRLPAMDTWGVLTLRTSTLANKKSIKPEDLWNEPLIISKQKYMDSHISKWMRKDFTQLNIVGTYNLLYNASIMVRKGLGHALGIDRLVNTPGDTELCFRPFNPQLHVAIYFAWKKYQIFSQPANLFLQRIISAFDANHDNSPRE